MFYYYIINVSKSNKELTTGEGLRNNICIKVDFCFNNYGYY